MEEGGGCGEKGKQGGGEAMEEEEGKEGQWREGRSQHALWQT